VISLVIGGARSGKSEIAERRAADYGGTVTYFATAHAEAGDEDFASRIARHRARRPAGWRTVELSAGGELCDCLAACRTTALVDSLGTWVADLAGFHVEAEELLGVLAQRRSEHIATVLVSEEVGLGVHPSTHVGRSFRDALGELNQRVSHIADEVLVVFAGRAIEMPSASLGRRGPLEEQ
jgi:adenosylcobinamide kinase/adenosylcobinamide-phosphate guanylyltransferase